MSLLERYDELIGETRDLIGAVLEWWEEHECDTTGPYGEYNVYDETPQFVRIAERLREKYPIK